MERRRGPCAIGCRTAIGRGSLRACSWRAATRGPTGRGSAPPGSGPGAAECSPVPLRRGGTACSPPRRTASSSPWRGDADCVPGRGCGYGVATWIGATSSRSAASCSRVSRSRPWRRRPRSGRAPCSSTERSSGTSVSPRCMGPTAATWAPTEERGSPSCSRRPRTARTPRQSRSSSPCCGARASPVGSSRCRSGRGRSMSPLPTPRCGGGGRLGVACGCRPVPQRPAQG
jgi:hypothetical protein